MSPDIRYVIVDLHNKIRNNVASGKATGKNSRFLPPGSNIAMLKWDKELAKIAQRWADQCVSVLEINQHDECKSVDRFSVGQNVIQAMRRGEFFDFKNFVVTMVNRWYIEVNKVNPINIARFSGTSNWSNHIGNFAQVVWARSKYIGCAHVTFTENSTTHGFGIFDRLVCNYGPSGNVIKEEIYKVGLPCTKCRCHSAKYPALCRDEFTHIKRKKRQSNIEVIPADSSESNIYKADEMDFRINKHLIQKLLELFVKLNVTLDKNLLSQLTEIHNKYNISNEILDINKHANEPYDVAYKDELEFQINRNLALMFDKTTRKSEQIYKTMNKKLLKVQNGKQGRVVKSRTSSNATRSTDSTKKDVLGIQKRINNSKEKIDSCQHDHLRYQEGDRCFCYYRF